MEHIDISKLDNADVLAALFNNSKQQGLGFLDARGLEPLTKETRQEKTNDNGIPRV